MVTLVKPFKHQVSILHMVSYGEYLFSNFCLIFDWIFFNFSSIQLFTSTIGTGNMTVRVYEYPLPSNPSQYIGPETIITVSSNGLSGLNFNIDYVPLEPCTT